MSARQDQGRTEERESTFSWATAESDSSASKWTVSPPVPLFKASHPWELTHNAAKERAWFLHQVASRSI